MIYGPPAAGKLTIAKELSKLIDYKICHNHLTVDLVESLISNKNKHFYDYINQFRYDLISILLKENINSILTMVFNPEYPKNFTKIKEMVEKYKSKIYFVQLTPSKKILLRRVKGKSRRNYGKATTIKKMKEGFKIFDLYAQFNHKNHLTIDNSNLPAKKVAQQIKEHFKLK